MGLTVQTTCNRYPSVVAALPAVVRALGDLGVRIKSIRTLAQSQAGKTDSITQGKGRLKTVMCERAFEIASAVLAYANTGKNITLAGKVKVSKSDLLRFRDTELIVLCQNTRTEATANLAALADHAVTTADLPDLDQRISAYEAALSKPQDARVSKRTATDNLDREFDEPENILDNRMDPFIPKFQAASPGFVEDCTNVPIIVDGGGSSGTPPTPPTPPAPPRP
jgi:hypothetical protein